jgi:hypothetical protein
MGKTQLVRFGACSAMMLICLRIPQAQTISPIPGFLQDLGGQIPIPEQFSFEPELQLGLQGNTGNGNPFAYAHGLQFRPWIHYDGIPHGTLTGAMSYIQYFSVPGTSYYRHPEWRFTTFGTLKQRLKGGSLYEQLRFELLNFRASNGDVQHLPRLRVRFGQNLFLSEGPSKPYLGIYQEALVQFPQPSYSKEHFQGARFFAGYGFDCGKEEKLTVLLGFRAQAEVSSSGSTVTLFYGPAFSVEYRFTRRRMNEKHERTTAFKDL